MAETLIIEALKTAFGLEISNDIVCKKNEIIVSLADGTKAKISAKKVD